jgi:hypothetical protein
MAGEEQSKADNASNNKELRIFVRRNVPMCVDLLIANYPPYGQSKGGSAT